MSHDSRPSAAPFDSYAGDYDAALSQGISVSGEDKNYFARGRLVWLSQRLGQLKRQPSSVLDFGCGTGSATPFFFDVLGVDSVLGLDISQSSIEVARQTFGSAKARFLKFDEYQPKEQLDLVFCNGVFHHIPQNERPGCIRYIFRCLRPGGLFALWENNPWNPGTRLVMSRIPFDRDAITLTPPESRRLVRSGSLEVLHIDFLFVFPRILRWLRSLEPCLARLPFGAQYQILCRKPLTSNG
jgi:SAM-dependent methyltransferase